MKKKAKALAASATIAASSYGGYETFREREWIGWDEETLVIEHKPKASAYSYFVESFQREGLQYEQVKYFYADCGQKLPPDPAPQPEPAPEPTPAPGGDEVDWSYNYVHAKEANAITTADKLVIGIVDTGVDLQHTDLKSSIAAYANYSGQGSIYDVSDYVGHGSWIAGHIAAINANGGMRGLTQSKLVVCKALTENGASQEALVQCLDFVWKAGAKIINNSWGGRERSYYIEQKLAQLVQAGVHVHIAAGNDGSSVSSPANYVPQLNTIRPGHAFAVRATDQYGNKARFSNDGPEITNSAPGVNMKATCPTRGSQMGQSYCIASGTSMATPTSAAVDALAMSVGRSMAYVGPLKIVDALASVAPARTLASVDTQARRPKHTNNYYLARILEELRALRSSCGK